MVNVPQLKRGVLDSIVDAIGNTPIVKLNNLTKDAKVHCTLHMCVTVYVIYF